ncbi:hypothetical protein AX15_000809 [Amanita polypyramis BW_CC]|nr:hypothetical protein AX15_000809 [Amanita polypyramis BW_CC]
MDSTVFDSKETMEISREGVEGLPNHWPDHFDDEGKDFKRVIQSFFATCKDLHVQVMRAIAIGMGLPEHFFDKFIDAGDNNLRLLHYPPVAKTLSVRTQDSSVPVNIVTMVQSLSFSKIREAAYRYAHRWAPS